MGYKLVIAEKPSVAMSIAKVIGARERKDGYCEGGGYIVSWCVGHLVELAAPQEYDEKFAKWKAEDLPILPDKWKYNVSNGTKKQFDVLKKLMARDDVTSLVCATDAGREGELIFRLVYNKCGCKKPFARLWISSMEDNAIKEGFGALKNGREYDSLYQAALCRERADWIVGINATRLFSCLYNQPLNVGRVMTPTLAMVVMRDAAIRGFVIEPFYTVVLGLDGFEAVSERMSNAEDAEKLLVLCTQEGKAVVAKSEQKEKGKKAPLLYDITSLQRDANRRLGFTAQQTLDYTQSLYEKKLVTYPRTDSKYLTEDMVDMLPELVSGVQNAFDIEKEVPATVNVGQVINSAKVSDHHAIIPTKTAAGFDMAELPIGERAVFDLIARRLVCAVGPPYKYMEANIELSCAEHTFTAKGKSTLELGWKIYDGKQKTDDAERDNKDIPVLHISEGQILEIGESGVKEGKTSPPKSYTEDTLLSAMETAGAEEMPDEGERKGIGTPATRAGIIEKLVKKGFIERRGDKKTKYLVSTAKGNGLITIAPEQIQSPNMTAEWEQKLILVERGEMSADEFLKEISASISELCSTYEVTEDAAFAMPSRNKVIGKCPACGADVAERAKSYSCSNSDCKFVLWKDNNYFKKLGKQMTTQLAEKLLKDGKAKLKGCHSQRTGKSYDAAVVMSVDESGRPAYELSFDKN